MWDEERCQVQFPASNKEDGFELKSPIFLWLTLGSWTKGSLSAFFLLVLLWSRQENIQICTLWMSQEPLQSADKAYSIPKSKTETMIYSSVFPPGRWRWSHHHLTGFFFRATWPQHPTKSVVDLRIPSRCGSRAGKAEPSWHSFCVSKPISLRWVIWGGDYFIPYYTRDAHLHWSNRYNAHQKPRWNPTLMVCSFLFLDGIKSKTPTDIS